ncbi:MAG: NAD(+)/NADH kinase [Acidobacteriia bacterium]|nr:NAD(+)/NADH kinase [Terriglobia bacterium]
MSRPSRAHRPIRHVLVVAKIGPEEGVRIAGELRDWLRRRGIRVRFDSETARAAGRKDGVPRSAIQAGTDLAIVAGGDGTLLSVARDVAPRGIPILGVNFGGLGFLTELQPDELYPGLEKLLRGESWIEERQALRVRFRRGGRTLREHLLLNDAVITKSALARMITVEVRVDGEEVATLTSDGLIVSTATGSTAYNLSAGGPILDPRMAAFVIAPICPHTLAQRPLVVPGTVRIDVRLLGEPEAVYLTLDGQVGVPMRPKDAIAIDRHPSPVLLVRVARRGFFDVLRRKLHWGDR